MLPITIFPNSATYADSQKSICLIHKPLPRLVEGCGQHAALMQAKLGPKVLYTIAGQTKVSHIYTSRKDGSAKSSHNTVV